MPQQKSWECHLDHTKLAMQHTCTTSACLEMAATKQVVSHPIVSVVVLLQVALEKLVTAYGDIQTQVKLQII